MFGISQNSSFLQWQEDMNHIDYGIMESIVLKVFTPFNKKQRIYSIENRDLPLDMNWIYFDSTITPNI